MDVCRNELGYHSVDLYLNLTCALCYFYTFHSADPELYPLKFREDGMLARETTNEEGLIIDDLFWPSAFDRDSAVYQYGFPGWDLDRHAELWKDCCKAASDCCNIQLSNQNAHDGCQATWDGWLCWNNARGGEILRGACPSYMNPLSMPACSGGAEKTCTEEGTWQRNYEENGTFSKEWTNYTACVNMSPFFQRHLIQISVHCISIIFLVPALLIFWTNRQLHVQRNLIHVNFFLSLFLYAVMLIVFQNLVTGNVLNDFEKFTDYYGKIECRILFAVTAYLRLCNYFWMFCEGLFLLRHLRNVFLREQNFLLYLLCGWGLPAAFTGAYVAVRAEETGCWLETKDHTEWIIKAPALSTLTLNLVFLCYIIYILVKNTQPRPGADLAIVRKSCRAVLVLMPLFGLHFFITAYRPGETCYNQWYSYLNSSLDGLQGFFVAVTFCYCNSEVINVLKAHFQRRWGNSMPKLLQRDFSIVSANCTKSPSISRSASSVTRLPGEKIGVPERFLRVQPNDHIATSMGSTVELEMLERSQLIRPGVTATGENGR